MFNFHTMLNYVIIPLVLIVVIICSLMMADRRFAEFCYDRFAGLFSCIRSVFGYVPRPRFGTHYHCNYNNTYGDNCVVNCGHQRNAVATTRTRPRKMCAICMTQEVTHCSKPCGHYIYCQSCIDRIFNNPYGENRCALCKGIITGKQVVFEGAAP
eukprot:356911_1